MKHLHLEVSPCLVVVGRYMQDVDPIDGGIASIHVCSALIGAKAHKRPDFENDPGYLEI